MCKTHQIAKQLDVTLLKRLDGAKVLPVPEHEPLEPGSYLVEKDGEKFVLKTGNFNDHEVDHNWELADAGTPVRNITESVPGEYILYEYVDAPLMAASEYWSDAEMQKVFNLQHEIEAKLNRVLFTDKDVKQAINWLNDRPLGLWLKETTNNPWRHEEVAKIREAIRPYMTEWSIAEGLERVYRDNNGEHYVDSPTGLVVLDVDIATRPKHYMDMRYLAWVILTMPMEFLSTEWVMEWLTKLRADQAHYITFLLSLVGIMWDIYANPGYAGQHEDKGEIVKELVTWLIDRV